MNENKYKTFIDANANAAAKKTTEPYSMIRGERIAILCDRAEAWRKDMGSAGAWYCEAFGENGRKALAIILPLYQNKK